MGSVLVIKVTCGSEPGSKRNAYRSGTARRIGYELSASTAPTYALATNAALSAYTPMDLVLLPPSLLLFPRLVHKLGPPVQMSLLLRQLKKLLTSLLVNL
jgi:hypothetical protein